MNSGQSLRKIWAFASSGNLTVFVLVMSITYVLILAVFGLLVETRWLDIMSGLLPFKLLYALFFINLILFWIKCVPDVMRRCKKAELPERAGELSRFTQATAVRVAGLRVHALKQYLQWRGYRVRVAERSDDSTAGFATLLYACSGRFSPLGGLLFHAGFLLLLLGMTINVVYRFEGEAVIAEGRPFTGGKAEYRTIGGAPAVALPDVDFDVEKITADFWDGKLLFTRLEAALLHRGGRDIARLSDAVAVGNAAVTISGYGYVPLYELKNKDGEIVDRALVILNVFPPGNEDYFRVRGYPHRVFVAFYPNYAVVDGKIVNQSMNPVNPAYFLRILRGRLPVYTGFVKPGEWANFDGLSISFPSFVKSGDFKIVRNPGHPLIWAAFVVMVAGLGWRLFFYGKEVALWRDDAGRVWLAGRFDYYPRLHADWLVGLAEEFKEESA